MSRVLKVKLLGLDGNPMAAAVLKSVCASDLNFEPVLGRLPGGQGPRLTAPAS